VEQGLKLAWNREKEARRTGAPFATWRRQRAAQVAIAWVLSVVFVRTLEDTQSFLVAFWCYFTNKLYQPTLGTGEPHRWGSWASNV